MAKREAGARWRHNRWTTSDRGRAVRFGARHLQIERLETRLLLAADPLGTPGEAGEGEPLATPAVFRLLPTDSSGTTIEQIAVGQIFYLNITVEDGRQDVQLPGVYSAYLDVFYDPDIVSVPPLETNPFGFDIEFGSEYTNGKSGNTLVPGLIDEVGALQTSFAPVGFGQHLVARIGMLAGSVDPRDDRFDTVVEDSRNVNLDVLANDFIQTGTVRFDGDPADLKPSHSVTLYDPPMEMADESLGFVGSDLLVGYSTTGLITAVGTPSAGGTVAVSTDGGHLIYSPAKNFSGQEFFEYTVVGGETAEVVVDVTPVNDGPVAFNDAYTVERDLTRTVMAAEGVLANDYDVDGGQLTARLVDLPKHGSVQLESDGSFQYVPDADYRGTDQFSYIASDGQAESAPALVQLDVGSPLVAIRLEVTDSDGNSVSNAVDGDSLLLRAWVSLLRSDAAFSRGIAAAYLDVIYQEEIVKPLLDASLPLGFEIRFGDGFQDPGSGDVSHPDLVDEVGSARLDPLPTGVRDQLLFEMPFEVVDLRADDDAYDVSAGSRTNVFDVLTNDRQLAWQVTFEADAADLSPVSDVLLYDRPGPVSEVDIVYSNDSVTVRNRGDLAIAGVSQPEQGGTVLVSSDGQHVTYMPMDGFEGRDVFQYTVSDGRGHTAQAEVVVQVKRSWQNLRNPLDVNSDSLVTPLDALLIINDLNLNQSHAVPQPIDRPPFLDVNGDLWVSPLDALMVINYLNQQASGEGEAIGRPRGASDIPNGVWPVQPLVGAEGEVGDREQLDGSDIRRADPVSSKQTEIGFPASRSIWSDSVDGLFRQGRWQDADEAIETSLNEAMRWLLERSVCDEPNR